MTTPLESIENTVTRLRVKVGPHGYHADEIARLKVKLEEAHTALGNDAVELKQWEKILDTLRAQKYDSEKYKEEFLRRHPDAVYSPAVGGIIENSKPRRGTVLMNSCDYVIPGSWVEKTVGGFGVLKSDNPVTKDDYIVKDDGYETDEDGFVRS